MPFRFHQTGAYFKKDGKLYRIKRGYQLVQARKANIDFRIGEYFIPDTAYYKKNPVGKTDEPEQMKIDCMEE